VASAYECQILGTTTSLPTRYLWNTAEPKCMFFAWLVLHDRVLTAHNLIKRNWPCDLNCSLCLYIHETTYHLLTECNYVEALWNLIATRFNLKNYAHMVQQGRPKDWVAKIQRSGPRSDKKNRLGILFTFWWGLWKERNRRIFDQEAKSPQEVSQFIMLSCLEQRLVVSSGCKSCLELCFFCNLSTGLPCLPLSACVEWL
jgi:hypothetical protein